jgi:hypothetical protein
MFFDNYTICNQPMVVGLYLYFVMYVRMKPSIGYGENRPRLIMDASLPDRRMKGSTKQTYFLN